MAISVKNISKEFKIYHDGTSLLGRTKEKTQVLKDISFDVMKGEVVGILGRNGAGKSTLLKIIAGIIEPTSGTLKVNGKISSLLNVNASLNRNLTAKENIVEIGLLCGLSKKAILAKIDKVLEFAELEKFADVPTSHFSTGMIARLGFSASMLASPDIVLIDEILAVGDYRFYQKSIQVFENIKKNNGTVILVSHSLQNIKEYCDRAILLHEGRMELIGKPDEVIKRYKDLGVVDGQDTTTSAPSNIYPDGSPFISHLPDLVAKKLRWRAKVLIEDNAFAFKDKSVLDIFCQNGELLYAALQTGAKYVEGMEFNKELCAVVLENFRQHEVPTDNYKIHEGNLFEVLRSIQPRMFDTIICNGVVGLLVKKDGLLEQIVRLKPSYVIIDAVVSDDVTQDNNNGYPSKSTLEHYLNAYGLKFEYIDWTNNAHIVDWSGLDEYLIGHRISILAKL